MDKPSQWEDPLELAKYVRHYYGYQPPLGALEQWLYSLAGEVIRLREEEGQREARIKHLEATILDVAKKLKNLG